MKIELSPWCAEYVTAARYANNEKIEANLRDGFPIPYTETDMLDYIRLCEKEDGKTALPRAILVDGEPVGSIGVFFKENVHRLTCEMGYWLGEPFWGKGIMTEAIRQMTALTFRLTPVLRIYAEPFFFNTASKRALAKASFTLEGVLRQNVVKRGAVHDSCLYAILRDEFSA